MISVMVEGRVAHQGSLEHGDSFTATTDVQFILIGTLA